MNEFKTRDIRITFTFFSGILSLIAYKHSPSALSYLFITVVTVLLSFVVFSPSRLLPLFKVWMTAAGFLGRMNTKLLLMLLFVLIFVPAGLLRRIYGKDPMQRRLRSGKSYWEPYELAGLKDKSRYEKQF